MVSTIKVADQREFANVLYYGDGGTGKTTDLATMANLGRVLYVDAESGIKRYPLEQMGVKVENLELLQFDDNPTFQELDDAFWQLKAELDADADSWVGVAWDSGTEIYHALLDSLVGKRLEKAEKAQRAGGKIADSLQNRFFIDRDEYGIMSQQVRHLLRRYRDLPCHFGISFLERRDVDESTGRVRVGPSVTPGLQSDVIGWHDIVCHTQVEGTTKDPRYVGVCRPDGVKQGKDRYGILPPEMADPTFERIVNYITGKITGDDDEVQNGLNETREVSATGTEGKPVSITAAKRAEASRATTAKKS
jgi:hypothetical protein